MTEDNANLEPSAITLPETIDDPPTPAFRDVFGLVILWSQREPHRTSEIGFLLPEVPVWVLGRAPMSGGEVFSGQPLTFFRQRPQGALDRQEPDEGASEVLGEAISRRQLAIHPRSDGLRVMNIGKCPMFVNRVPVSEALVRPGDTIYLRSQILLLCVRRQTELPPLRMYPKERARNFAKPDADGMIGENPAMWKLREQLASCAQSNFHVLITGESGCGKELAAQAIHRMSARAENRLVADNIAAIAPSLASAVLFGNRRNFPNPGMEERIGLIGAANNSTLYLDEIGDMPEEVQPMFLRVTERSGEYFRLGEENRCLRSDFRLVGATNRARQMRHELRRRFQREVRIPTLNQRREDIPLLINHILRQQAQRDDPSINRFFRNGVPRVHPTLIDQLVRHSYITNVSEVAFLLGVAMNESPDDVILLPEHGFVRRLPGDQSSSQTLGRSGSKSSPPQIPSPSPPAAPIENEETSRTVQARRPTQPLPMVPDDPPLTSGSSPVLPPSPRPQPRPLPTKERATEVLIEYGGDVTKAAAALGISRDQLNRMIQRDEIFVPKVRRKRGTIKTEV